MYMYMYMCMCMCICICLYYVYVCMEMYMYTLGRNINMKHIAGALKAPSQEPSGSTGGPK